MTTITTIQSSDVIANSRADINTNFTNLNTDKIETSTLDTDTTLAANSDSKIATQKAVKAYVDASVNPTGRSWNEYAADAGSTDSYAITVSGVSAYVTGQTFKFKANTANTGACTLNVSALGAKTIKKDVTTDLATGDILANQIVTVIYDGTNMQLIATPPSSTAPIIRTYLAAASPATWTKPAGLKYIEVQVQGAGGNGGTNTTPGTGGTATGGDWNVTGGTGGTGHGGTGTGSIGGASILGGSGAAATGAVITTQPAVSGYGHGGSGSSGGNPGSGGGGGGYAKKILAASELASTETITIGAVGSASSFAVSGGTNVVGNTGNNAGGSTSGAGGVAIVIVTEYY